VHGENRTRDRAAKKNASALRAPLTHPLYLRRFKIATSLHFKSLYNYRKIWLKHLAPAVLPSKRFFVGHYMYIYFFYNPLPEHGADNDGPCSKLCFVVVRPMGNVLNFLRPEEKPGTQIFKNRLEPQQWKSGRVKPNSRSSARYSHACYNQAQILLHDLTST
jgi:hypothetical protein